MSLNRSRYLLRLDAEIQAAATERAHDCLRAERACYLARQGHYEDARSVLIELRHAYKTHPDVLVSSWLWLLDGLIAYFSELSSPARDRILRAHALSQAAAVRELQALSAAWLAQMDFARLDIESTAKFCREAIDQSHRNLHSARGRVSLVLAHALHVARRYDLALPWYRRAQHHAVELGDDATISAHIYNMAGMRVENLRQEVLQEGLKPADSDLVLAATESARLYDQMIGAASLDGTISLLRARVLSLRDQPADALDIYQRDVVQHLDGIFYRLKSEILSDVAYCQIRLGDVDSALESAKLAASSIVVESQIDDVAATHSRLARVFELNGNYSCCTRHRLHANADWRRWTELQGRIVEQLGAVSIDSGLDAAEKG